MMSLASNLPFPPDPAAAATGADSPASPNAPSFSRLRRVVGAICAGGGRLIGFSL
jgi:hypothetical protein